MLIVVYFFYLMYLDVNSELRQFERQYRKQGVICLENSRKISSRFSLSAVNFHGS